MTQSVLDKIRRAFGIKKHSDVKKKIRDAAENRNVAKIRYQKKEGKTKSYEIEPYSYRRFNRKKYLFGHDKGDDRIKMFLMKNIKSANVTEDTFDPRHPIEIGKTAGFLFEMQKNGMDSINPLISVSKGPAKHTSSIFGPQNKKRLKMTYGGVRSTGKAHKGLKNFLKSRERIINKLTVGVPEIPQ